LPTVRELAGNLMLAANTVARAYRELEAAGVVETQGRRGTFVAQPTDPTATARLAAEDYARNCADLGVDPVVALDLVRAALAL
jgi:DNA-binding transcriptional regulator YhcF (GntR family)